jgi:hypothetical protein
MGLYEFGDAVGRIGMGKGCGGVPHGDKRCRIIEKRQEFGDKAVAVEFVIGNKDGRSDPDKCRGVGSLMIPGSDRKGNEHRSESDLGKFGDRCSSRATDE